MQQWPQALGWRIAWRGVALVALLFSWPIGYLFTRPADRAYVMWGGALMVGSMLVLLAVDVLQRTRARRAHDEVPAPRHDAVWDHAAADEGIWDKTRAMGGRGAFTGSAERTPGVSHAEGIEGFLIRLEAGPPTGDGRRRVMLALENATLALGIGLIPSVWVLNPSACMNAFLAGEKDKCAMVFSRRMLDAFTDDELMAVCANLLCRRAEDAAFAFEHGLFTPTPSAEQLFGAAVDLYCASDRLTVLAMRDAAPLRSALTKTLASPVWSPGATIRDAFAAWTWPGDSPTDMPGDPLAFVQMAVEAARGDEWATAPRVEGLRLAELTSVAPT